MDDIDKILVNRIDKVLPNKDGLEKLMGERKIKLYQGFDPTGTRLHLGHAIGLKKLMEFANLGHEATILVGTGTVLVGDPSQRDTGRKLITQDEIDKNIKEWKDQMAPIIDFEKVNFKQNGDWLTKLTIKDVINIASNISALQLFKRESFQRRIEKGDIVWFHETMYPLLQGYDSVHMDIDLEIGGTDQEFNMLIGRELLRKMKGKEKYVLTVPMVTGTDGKQMSKSSGNCIWMDDTPEDKFGKAMACLDSQIIPYMNLLTDMETKEVGEVKSDLKSGKVHPLDAKKRLAHEIVAMWNGKDLADKAKENFENTFQKGETPKEIIPVFIESNPSLCEVISPVVGSKSEAKRLVAQGGIDIDGKTATDPNLELKSGEVIKIGKKKFVKVTKK